MPEEAEAFEDDLLSGDGLARAVQADLAELRGICMGFARKIAAKAERQAAAENEDELVRLNAAAAKAARAARFIAVLQLEIDGQRQTPGTRIPPAANGNAPATGRSRASGRRAGGEYTEQDHEIYEAFEGWRNEQHELVRPAINADFLAFGREDATRQALLQQAKLILSIPHPNLDECLKILDPRYVAYLFGAENVSLVLGPGPPGVWESFEQYAQQRAAGSTGRPHQTTPTPPSS